MNAAEIKTHGKFEFSTWKTIIQVFNLSSFYVDHFQDEGEVELKSHLAGLDSTPR